MPIKIVVPSRGRANMILTNVENMIIAVHESERKDYEGLPFEKIYHREQGLSNIRQWIYRKFGDVFMVDDDIYRVQRLYTDYSDRERNLTPREAYNIVQELYYMARQVGAKIFGFASSPKPLHYIPQRPFVSGSYINTCAIGLRKDSRLFFNPDITAADSYWINLLNAFHNRFSLKDTRFVFYQRQGSTFNRPGGLSGIRTLDKERQDSLYLRKKFGESILLKKETSDTGVKHEYQRKLNIRL